MSRDVHIHIDLDGFDGYRIAEAFDQALTEIHKDFPPRGFALSLEWLKLLRTVRTTLDLMEEEAKARYKEALNAKGR